MSGVNALARAADRPPLPFIHPDDMPDVYAITGVGTCMEPDLPDGSLLAFTKRVAPQPGEIVGIVFTREAGVKRGLPGLIKRLVIPPPPAGFNGLIVVEQISPPRSYSIPTTDVLAIHKFVGVAQSGGDGRALIHPDSLKTAAVP